MVSPTSSNSRPLPSQIENMHRAAKAAGEELNRARVIEWATAFQPARSLGHLTILQTPFDRAMAGRTFYMRSNGR